MKKGLLSLLFILSLGISGLTPLRAADTTPQDATTRQPTNQLPELTPEQEEMLKEYIQDSIEALYKEVLKQLNGVDGIAQELALLINKNQITKDAQQKKDLIASITELRKQIDQIRTSTAVTVDMHTIYILLSINNAIMEHLSAALDAGFKSLPVLNLSQPVEAALRAPLSEDKIEQLLHDNAQLLEKVSKKAQNAGLNWCNHTMRALNNWVIQPIHKYKIDKIGGLTAIGLFGLWWYNDSKRLPWLRNLLGWRPRIGYSGELDREYHFGTSIDNSYTDISYDVGPCGMPLPIENHVTETIATTAHPLKALGGLEWQLVRINKNLSPIAALAIPFVWSSCKQEASAAKEWVKRKFHNNWNKMLGGSYAERTTEAILAQKEAKANFDSVVGCEHAKKELQGVIKYIQDPERSDRNGLSVEQGYLLIGPTRTGKSFMAEALAGEIRSALKQKGENPLDFGFYPITAAEILKYGISNILHLIKAKAPCILFIDEIDLLGLQRVGGDRELLSEFLIAMSGCIEKNTDKKVIIIGATNNPQNMDKALKQPGRFGKIIRFDYPGLTDRKTFLSKKLHNLAVNTEGFDLDCLAKKTDGCSFEHLDSLLRKALQETQKTGTPLNQELLKKALDTEVRGIIFEESKQLTDQEEKIIATHQAGHALAQLLLPTSKILDSVTIRPILTKAKDKEVAIWDNFNQKNSDVDEKIIEYGNYFIYSDSDSLKLYSINEQINTCKIELAGHVAEEVLLGGSSYSYHENDRQKAHDIVKKLVFKGIEEKILSKQVRNDYLDKVMQQLETYEQEVRDLLEKHKELLAAVTEQLRIQRSLRAADIQKLLDEHNTKTDMLAPATA